MGHDYFVDNHVFRHLSRKRLFTSIVEEYRMSIPDVPLGSMDGLDLFVDYFLLPTLPTNLAQT